MIMAGLGLCRLLFELYKEEEEKYSSSELFPFCLLQVHHRGGARLERAGLPVGLHLLSVRSPQRLWRRHHALQRPGRCAPN